MADDKSPNRFRGTRALLMAIVVFAVASAGVATYFGLRGGGHQSTDVAVSKAPTTTPTTGRTTTQPTTAPPSTTAAPASTQPTSSKPTTTAPLALPDTAKPVAVTGGSFVVISGNVKLTHVVDPGDTLFGIAGWYKLMGGDTALYDWNHSVVGNNPNLILPGEVLTITVPGQDIPKISPVYLAETTEAG